MSNSSPLMHCVANSPHCGHCGSKSVMRNSFWHFGQRCTRGIHSTCQRQLLPLGFLHDALKPELQRIHVHSRQFADLDSHLRDADPGWRAASFSTHSRIDDAMPNSCMEWDIPPRPAIVASRGRNARATIREPRRVSYVSAFGHVHPLYYRIIFHFEETFSRGFRLCQQGRQFVCLGKLVRAVGYAC